MTENELSKEISNASIEVHRQKTVEVLYNEIIIIESLYLDILVNNKVIIEVKATENNCVIHNETQNLRF
jgi:GxxExxY protein